MSTATATADRPVTAPAAADRPALAPAAPATTPAPLQPARPAAPPPLTLGALEPEPPEGSAALLRQEFRDILQSDCHIQGPLADIISDGLTRGLRNRWGGREVYIPAEDKTERNRRIREAWRGNNASELMVRFCVSKTTLYRVLNDRA